MANDDDKYQLPEEESEYQFTDDQINYDMEGEPEAEKTPVEAPPKERPIADLTKYKRPLIAVAVFFVLIFVVYRMLGPQTPPPTDFAQNGTARPTTTTPPNTPKSLVPNVEQAPGAPKKEEAATASAPPAFAPSPPTTTAQATTEPLVPFQPRETTAPPPTSAPAAQTPLVPAQAAAPINPPPPTNPDLLAKVELLEEQNTKLQAQYMQKIADYEALNTSTQEKIQALNMKLARIEISLNKMSQVMLESRPMVAKPIISPVPPPPKVIMPRLVYVVQAIIPGRAWLKSETGETVTVAEGDSLKGYGRISKIDPYDGIVEIDTGSKVITLSYGLSGD